MPEISEDIDFKIFPGEDARDPLPGSPLAVHMFNHKKLQPVASLLVEFIFWGGSTFSNRLKITWFRELQKPKRWTDWLNLIIWNSPSIT